MNNYCLGIDIGATNIRVLVYDMKKGYYEDFFRYKFIKIGEVKEEVELNVCSHVDEIMCLKREEGKTLSAIGLAVAANFERSTGVITVWPNNKVWNGFRLREYIYNRYMVNIIIEDDANAAAMGELITRKGLVSNLLYITVGSGVGCGIIINNQLYIGENGWAGEFGHIKVVKKGIKCSCGANGCLQTVASGIMIKKRIKQIVLKKKTDERYIYLEAAKYLGEAISNLIMLFDINLIVLGGGVMDCGTFFFQEICKNVNRNLSGRRSIKIEMTQINHINGALGAAELSSLSHLYREDMDGA